MNRVTYHSNGDAECINCGNIWDGNAQCTCWQWMYTAFDEFGELDESSDNHEDDDDAADDAADDEDAPDDLTDTGHTDSEDIDIDDEFDDFNDIAINLNTIFDNIEVE